MGYTIELSFNARKHNNVTELKSHVNTIAYSYNCDRYYTIDEIGGVDNKITQHQSVTVVTFDNNKLNNCLEFIKKMKKERRNGLHIESIYEDECTYKLIYASSSYLKQVEKHNAIEYKKTHKKRILDFSNNPESNPEYLILKQFYKI